MQKAVDQSNITLKDREPAMRLCWIISALHTPQTQLARELNYVFIRDTKNDTTSQDREKLKKKL